MSVIDKGKSRVRAEKDGFPPFRLSGNEDPIFMENVKGLRAKLEHLVDAFKYKTLAVTSSIAGEGKTMLCAHLAWNFSVSGRWNVLLVDVDMRKGDMANRLGIPSAPGLSEHLTGAATYEEVVRNSVTPGMHFVAAGSRAPSPPDLLARTTFHDFIAQSRDRYDLVLMDTPPVIPVADTLGLRDFVDGFLFLYRAGHTPYTLLRQSVEEIGEKRIVGLVMNGVTHEKHSYYRKYYGKYYTKQVI